MQEIIDGKRYDTETAELVTDDEYWDGSNWDRRGRNTYLYRTKKGAFFLYYTTRWQGERNSIRAIDIEEARVFYEQLPDRSMSYKDAFGDEPEEG